MKYTIIEEGNHVNGVPVELKDPNGVPYKKVRAFDGDLVVDKIVDVSAIKTEEQQIAEIVSGELDGLDEKTIQEKNWTSVETDYKETHLIAAGAELSDVVEVSK